MEQSDVYYRKISVIVYRKSGLVADKYMYVKPGNNSASRFVKSQIKMYS